jgi:hypothetical protein
MDFKNILLLLFVSLMLIGAVSAHENINDFKIDGLDAAHNGNYYSLYLNEKQDSGIAIYHNADDDAYGDEDNDAYDNLIHDDGSEYITPDDDMKITKNHDNTISFTDYEHGEHGVAELIKDGSGEYIVVFFAKDTSDMKDSDLMSQLKEFNKENNVEATAL